MAAVLLVGCRSTTASPRLNAVATIGHHIITPAELNTYVQYVVAFDALAYPDSTEATCRTRSKASACRRLRDQALGRLLEERVVLDYASAHGIALQPDDRQAIGAEIDRLASPDAPTHTLFRKGTVNRAFMRSILERQVLVQKVQAYLASERTVKGLSFHVRRIRVALPSGPSRSSILEQVSHIAGGGPVPAGASAGTSWIAAFRLPREVRGALRGARPGQYVGPFQHSGEVLLVQLLGRGVHAYGGPARQKLSNRIFAQWLDSALRSGHPRCMSAAHRLVPCPSRIVKAA